MEDSFLNPWVSAWFGCEREVWQTVEDVLAVENIFGN